MSQLAYRTRGSASPQGKPRVYFCCHPADQSTFLEPVVKDLLAQADCAVWYDPEPVLSYSPGEWEERKSDLAQMQLFVLPVTTRLLTRRSPALEWEFPLAVEQHIPVLPILQEPGLEVLFNEKCGDLQCLDPNQADPTALPYEEKLKKFLAAVLIGDELAAQIRAAFDAYIFLSYRKKDRREAQSLMRLIHKSEFCRDIAIWYDEFLNPGEDFNQAIAKALEKSNLFVLAVTPHLLENPNYVMREEFPAAKNSGKPILPVEMVPADRAELETVYPGIPPCASGQGGDAFSEELKAALLGLALREKDSDPRHNFFIGLAYLNGIDVEVDKKRAVPLIHGAADAGLIEAMEKLVSMYCTGEGVARNYRQAVLWQRRLTDALRVQWETESTEDTFRAFADALWDLGDQYADLAELSAAGKVWEAEFLPLAQQGEERGISCARRYRACGYSSLGNLYRQRGDLPEARHWLKKSAKLRLDLSRGDNTIQIRRDMVESQIQLGVLCCEEKDDNAAMYFGAAAELARGLVRDAGDVKDRKILALACEWLASAYLHEVDTPPDLPEARKLLEESLHLRRAMNGEAGTVTTRRELAATCMTIGDVLRKQNDLSGARRHYEESLELYCALAEETEMLDARRNLALCHCRLGVLFRFEGDLSGARRCYEAGRSLFQDIVDQTGTVDARRDLAYGYRLLSTLCRKEGDLAGAQRWLEESVELCRAIVGETDHPGVRDAMALDLYRLGCLPGGNAVHLYEAAELWDRLSTGGPSASQYAEGRRDAVIALAKHTGQIKIPERLEPDVRFLLEENLTLARNILTGPVRDRSWRYLAAGYLKMGTMSRIEDKDGRGCYWFREGLRMMRSIAKDSGAPEDQHALAMILCDLGCLPGGDIQFLQDAVEVWTCLMERCPQAPQYVEFRDIAAALLAKRTGEPENPANTGAGTSAGKEGEGI